MLTLEMYKLEKTFEGDISLGEGDGVYSPAEPKGGAKPEGKDPLDEIIERINERYKGNFTDGDRVMISALAEKLRGNTRLANMAVSSDPQIFAESIFPQAFSDAAQDSYMESQETYSSLFEDQSKYNAIMHTLAEILYREMRSRIEYYQSHGARETLQKYGIVGNSLYNWLGETGVEPIGSDHTRAIALYREKGKEAVLEEYGIARSTLRDWLREAGIHLNSPKYSAEFKAAAVAMTKEKALTAVAKELGIPASTLATWKTKNR